jgi:hypothetical protein
MKPVSNLRFFLGGLAAWPVLMGIATIDGIARETKLAPWMGHRPALILSGAIMVFAIYVVAWLLLSWWGRPTSASHLWLVGISWVALTIIFEGVLLVYARGQPVGQLLAGYHPLRILDGNLIVPGLVLMLVAPAVVSRVCWARIEGPAPHH